MTDETCVCVFVVVYALYIKTMDDYISSARACATSFFLAILLCISLFLAYIYCILVLLASLANIYVILKF